MTFSLPLKWLCPVPSIPVRTFEIAALAAIAVNTLALVCLRNLRRSILYSFLRIPDCRANEALRMFFGVEVVNGDHLAVLALDAARIAEIPTSAVLAKDLF